MKKYLESDLSGQPDASSVAVGMDGMWYEIDLTEQERDELQGMLRRYLEAGRKTGVKEAVRRKQVPETSRAEREAMRAWALEQGYELNAYGRIPREIREAYDEAHGITR